MPSAFQVNAFQTDAFQIDVLIPPELNGALPPIGLEISLLHWARNSRQTHVALRAAFEITTPLSTILRGQDLFFGGPGQTPTYDWTQQNLLTVDTARRLGEKQWLHSQSDILNRVLGTTLLGQDTFFGGPGQSPASDWPQQQALPPIHAARQLSEKQWLHAQDDLQGRGVTHTLLGQDAFFGAPGQTPTYDWTMWGLPKTYPAPQVRVVAMRSMAEVRASGAYNIFWRALWVSQPPYRANYDQVVRRAHYDQVIRRAYQGGGGP